MRQKKHKKVQRTLTFLKISHHFREPYKVVLDGNFINALLQTKTDATEALGKLLSTPVKAYTSRCVLAELRQLGPDFADAVAAARNYMVLRCGHEDDPRAPSECLTDLVGGGNPEHLFIASQDRTLRAALMKQPGCAAVFASVNGLHLEAPSEAQKAEARATEAQHLSVAPHELKSEALAAAMEEAGARKGKGIFKRKKAKGPNPLAVKKGKKGAQRQGQGGGGPQQKPHRKRARRRGGARAAEGDAEG